MSDQSKRFPFAILRPERIATAQKIFIKLHSTPHSAGKTKLTLFDTQTHRRKGVGKYAFFYHIYAYGISRECPFHGKEEQKGSLFRENRSG